jgi:HipA-like protein
MNQVLHVYWDAQPEPIGALVRKPGGDTVFRYSKAGRQISHSLPFDAGAREHRITFFENLLPDGVQRERLAAPSRCSSTSVVTARTRSRCIARVWHPIAHRPHCPRS